MFVLLLLISLVTCEWVEIAQNHYLKKPNRKTNVIYEESTQRNRLYANYSVTERAWSRDIATKIPNLGIVNRVQLPSKAKDLFSIRIVRDQTRSPDRKIFRKEYDYFNTVRGTNIRRAENFEIKNVSSQEYENSEQADEFGWKLNVRSIIPSRHFHSIDETHRETHLTPTTVFQENRRDTINGKIQTSKTFNDRTTEIAQSINKINLEGSDRKILHGSFDANEVQVVKESNMKHERNSKISVNRNDNNITIKRNPNENATSESSFNAANIHSQTFLAQPSLDNKVHYNTNLSNTVIHHNDDKVNQSYLEENKKLTAVESSTKVYEKNNVHQSHENSTQNYQDTVENEYDHLTTNSKGNTIEVIWKFMKIVTDNISRNTRRSFRSKILYLESLRNNILANIEDRIEQAWPDDKSAGASRRRRAAHGHVEFPSSESALMTISFLTFAVFLIKLVLQVIHTYKNKTMMVTPAVVAAVGRAATGFKRQP